MADWPSPSGSAAALDALCANAGARHERIRAQLAFVQRLLADVGTAEPPGADVAARVADLEIMLERHGSHEEQILWPAFAALAEAVRRGQPRPPLPFPTLLHPVRWMEGQHTQLREQIDRVRRLTDAPTAPPARAETWRRLRDGVAALDTAVADHSRFELEVLYPEALEVERQLG